MKIVSDGHFLYGVSFDKSDNFTVGGCDSVIKFKKRFMNLMSDAFDKAVALKLDDESIKHLFD